jgi:hypothetical protein
MFSFFVVRAVEVGDQLEVLAGPKNSVSGGDLWVMDDGEQNF